MFKIFFGNATASAAALEASVSGTASVAAVLLTEFAYPTVDLDDGGWTPSTGSDLYATVDDVPVDDGVFMYSSAGSGSDTAQLGFSALSTPAGNVTIHIRHQTGGA